MKVHNNKRLISWNLKPQERPNLLMILAYQREYKLNLQVYACLRLVLPMKVHASPVLIALTHNTHEPWRARWTDSLSTIIQMQTLIRCYATIPSVQYYADNKERCEKTYKMMCEGTDEMEEELMGQLDADDFKEVLRAHTLKYIHLLERCLIQLFKVEINVLTPCTNPDDIKLDEDAQKLYVEQAKLFYRTKENNAEKSFFTFKQNVVQEYRAFLKSELINKK